MTRTPDSIDLNWGGKMTCEKATFIWTVCAILGLALVTGCDNEAGDDDDFDPLTYLVDSSDNNYELYTGEWWQWAGTFEHGTGPVQGEACDQHQDYGAFFLAGSYGGESTRNCTVSKDQRIFLPICNWVCYSCPYVFQEEDCQFASEEGAEACARGYPDPSVTMDMWAKVNGIDVPVTDDYIFYTDAYPMTYLDPGAGPLYEEDYDWDCADPWTEGNVCDMPADQPKWAASAGHHLMFEPFPPGEYTLQFHCEFVEWKWFLEITYNLTIE
jgi:hypothetical protein